MVKIIRSILTLFTAAAILSPSAAVQAQDIPANDGWVTDLGGFLTPQQEAKLEQLMESYKQGSGNEIALLTVPNLGGRPIEDYALRVARKWGIGEEGKHNGALLLVARSEREIRIEVGRGLEGNITDAISGRIIRGLIAPEFKQGRYYEGLLAGIEALQEAAGGDYANIPQVSRGRSGGGIGLFPLMLIIFVILRIFGRRGGGGRGGGALGWLLLGSMLSGGGGSSGGGSRGGGFGGFGGGGGFSGGGASGGW